MATKDLDLHEACVILDRVIKKKVNNQPIGPFQEDWRNLPEIPNSDEILPPSSKKPEASEYWNDYQKEATYNGPTLPSNNIQGPWPSTEEFLKFHYLALREDSIHALRNCVASFRAHPEMNEDKETYIYSKVHFTGLILAVTGVAFRVTFSTERSGVNIRWEQSKRLQQGTLVAISTERDMFSSICKVAIVAARPLEGGLDQNPPKVDLFWGEEESAVLDPAESYIMIEARSGYFEAYRHVLMGIQDVAMEEFSLQKHIVALDNDIPAPAYLQENPYVDITSLCSNVGLDELESLQNFNILENNLPQVQSSTMDNSQLNACQRILTKSLAVVQGPPGTGKTFTTVAALKALISKSGNDVIVVAAQTNHALDQLLNHILAFEENILRLGGRCSKNNEKILHRTLYELRQSTTSVPNGRQGIKFARREVENQQTAIKYILAPLLSGKILDEKTLLQYECISAKQAESLSEDGWVNAVGVEGVSCSIGAWLGESGLLKIPVTPPLNDKFPMEEEDLDLNIQEESDGVDGNEEFNGKHDLLDTLIGENVPILRWLTGNSGVYNASKCQRMLQMKANLYDIPPAIRGPIYCFWEKKVDGILIKRLREALKQYKRATESLRSTKALCDVKLIKHLGIKVVGCTTTGLSKYRGLLSALQPKVLLVEEAAESLESNIVAAQYNSLEQLVLVGDHKQLRANVTNSCLADAPFFLNVSMFERLVNNGIQYTMLDKQRRMIPVIRRLLSILPKPFYNNLYDHESVLDPKIRPPVPGMGDRSLYFFHHEWPELRDSSLSMYNQDEAEMIACFFNYLVLSGTPADKVTILTFYNGQRRAIVNELKKIPKFKNLFVNVFTVDSYQGEENDIVLLSMVRSNNFGNIGFLENQNRVVVALSRARCGFYLFGNAGCLMATEATEDSLGTRSGLYRDILVHMRDNQMLNVDRGLPITCVKHGRELYVGEADHFLQTNGGCNELCDSILLCGHPCPAFCHTFHHAELICPEPCPKRLDCGHGCSEICGNRCKCDQCAVEPVLDRRAKNWNTWDAEKADENLAQIVHDREATVPKIDRQKLVFNDIWLPTANDDGVRIKASKAIRTVISRVDNLIAMPSKDDVEFPALPKASLKSGGFKDTGTDTTKAPVSKTENCTSQYPTKISTARSRSTARHDPSRSPQTRTTQPEMDGELLSLSSPTPYTSHVPKSFADLEGLQVAFFNMETFEVNNHVATEASTTIEEKDRQDLIQY